MVRRLCLVLFCFLCTAELRAEPVFEELWTIDKAESGLTAVVAGSNQPAEIVIDEQQAYRGGGHDVAPRKLFSKVDPAKLSRPTYQAFRNLIDNYDFSFGGAEDALGDNPEEDSEIDAFLEAVLQTKVMKRTLEYLNPPGAPPVSRAEFKALLLRIWFEPYDNFYRRSCSTQAKAPPETTDCTGFEHVFLGEQNASDGFGGYHFWYLHFLHEQSGEMDFLGHNYNGVQGGELSPDIATFAAKWDSPAGPLTKEITGFLVGASPELMLAWGTLAYLESEKQPNADSPSLSVTINGARADLILYRESLRECENNKPKRGPHIRTFYPKLIAFRPQPVRSAEPATPHPAPHEPHVRITRALINPSGNEDGKEWIELTNATQTGVDLTGWTLEDVHHRRLTLAGELSSGQTRRVMLQHGSAMRLRNSGGVIALRDSDKAVVDERSYGPAAEDHVVEFE